MQASVNLLVVGASGLVGRHVLALALADPRVKTVIALGRRVLPAHPKLLSPVVNFDQLPDTADWWHADAVICTLGTTLSTAGSQLAFRRVDFDYPLAVARLARAAGTPTFALTSAVGANVNSRFFYNRTKGELEQTLAGQGFSSLTFVRPGVIGGSRVEFRLTERVMVLTLRLMRPLLPTRWRLNPPEKIAQALLEAAIQPVAGIQVVTSDRMT